MLLSILTSKGQATIPAEIRQALHLNEQLEKDKDLLKQIENYIKRNGHQTTQPSPNKYIN